MQSDPLSDFLLSLSAKSTFFTGLYAGGEWAISFPAPEGFKFNTVSKGSCWLTVENTGEPVFLHEGDCFLLSRQRAFTLGSGPDVKTINAQKVYCNAVNGIARYGTEEDFYLVGGRFEFNEDMSLISELLPPVLIIRRNAPQADALHWSLEKLANELAKPQHGSALMICHLGHIMLVQALRLSFRTESRVAPGLLAGLTDTRVARVIRAIHEDPSRHWRLAELAAIACLSRSALAQIFREKTGIPPVEYVLRWRMQLAGRALINSDTPVSSLGQAFGYDSDSAFSHAFRRIKGLTPSEYRKTMRLKTMN